jgi:hypothetical protein
MLIPRKRIVMLSKYMRSLSFAPLFDNELLLKSAKSGTIVVHRMYTRETPKKQITQLH